MKGVRLVTDTILGNFAQLVYANQRRAYRLWLLSPWIGAQEDGEDALLLLLDALRDSSCSVILVTRPPQLTWHDRAVELLKANSRATVYLAPSLHTKLYVLECDGFRAAVLGSPNLTPRADRKNREIAVEFRTTVESHREDVAVIITELTEYASSLRGEDDVRLL